MDDLYSDWRSLFPDLGEFEGQPIELVSEELKIEGMELHPEKDGQRVVMGIAITPTHRRPNLDVVILTSNGTVVAETSIIESRSRRQVLTMHLRPSDPSLTYTVKAGLLLEGKLIDSYETELIWPR